MSHRVRQTDVAKLAGVSPATVSVILNNRRDSNVRISAATRERVLAAVAQLGYVTDPVARSLAGGQNALLGIFTTEPIFADFNYPFLAGIEQEAERLGYDLLLFTSGRGAAGQRAIYQGNINQLQLADGAILLGAAPHQAELARLVDDQYPFVLVGRGALPDRTLSYVAADYATATARIVTEMLMLGHRQIAYLGSRHDYESHRECYAGYRMAFRQQGLTHLAGAAQQITAAQVTPAFLHQAQTQGVTAFVIERDLDLIEPFLGAMATVGKRAPTDFSLALLGDAVAGMEAPYPITSFQIPRAEMARRAVQLLVAQLQATQPQPARQAIIPCPPSAGTTIAPPA